MALWRMKAVHNSDKRWKIPFDEGFFRDFFNGKFSFKFFWSVFKRKSEEF